MLRKHIQDKRLGTVHVVTLHAPPRSRGSLPRGPRRRNLRLTARSGGEPALVAATRLAGGAETAESRDGAQGGAPRGAGEPSHVKTLSGIDPDAILGFLETALAFGRFFGSGGSSLLGAPARAGDRERAEIIANINASLDSLDGLVAVRPCGPLLAAGHGDGSITLAFCAAETISADKSEQKRLLREARALLSRGAPAVAGHLCEDGSALYAEAYWDRNILERPCGGRPAWEANIVLIP